MPRASKKQKDKGASGSGSSIEVCNPNFHVRLENNLGRAILSERNMDLNNLLGFEVSQMVDAMGWRQLERLDVGKIIRRAITQAARVDSLVMPFPALITYFCEQASLVLDEGDHIAQMDGSLNSRTFNDISTQRNEEGLQVLDTRKRRRRDDAAHAVERAAATADEAEDAAEEDLGVVPVGDRRPD
ncbi:hypothetical protein LWI28_015746 [Acer negundo]|uniref:Uncharacterized protein n=1 Tax=Acer negundo TaxID=4023 RepID=A0AAD5IR72_ACENE|nr:hypothetical protein LWI28_015746 [Acer negundo]